MSNGGRRQNDGLWRDLGALRRYAWIPVVCVVVGVVAAFALGAAVDDEQEARFRANIVVNALPPLFGPPVLPGPFDYAAVATSDAVVGQVAAQHGLTPDELRPRLSAEPRVNTPEIDFKVTGDDALSIAQTWNQVFGEAAGAQTPLIQAELTLPYVTQLDEAGIRLNLAANEAARLPDDAIAQAGLAAAQENYETASKLDQSYNIVGETMTAQSFTMKAPHAYGGGLGSPAARVAAGAISGLVLGVLLALMLDAIDRRKARADEIDEAPPSLRRVEQHTGLIAVRLLLICALDVWSLDQGKGAPTLERTLRSYGERGHVIDAVMPDIGANHFYRRQNHDELPESRPSIPNVAFHTVHVPSARDLPLPSLPGPVAAVDQKLRFALGFPWVAGRRAGALLRDRSAPYDAIYAYEVHGVLAARLLRRRGFRLPLITRFQGTVMHPALDDRLLYARRYEEALALKTAADLVIMTDDGTRGDEVIARLNPAMRSRLKFWRNGLDLDRLHAASTEERAAARRSLAIPHDAFVMVTASRLAAWKRVDRAIRALPRIRSWVPNTMLLVVGDGEERGRLEALARDLRVADAVRFAGAVPQSEVMRHMHASDAFLAIADLSNVGNPLLEAMACGICIVAVDAGDTKDLIADGRTGRLVDSANRSGIARPLEERMADLLVSLAGDAPERSRLAEGAAAYAREHFWTWEQRMAAEVEAVEALVTRAGAPEPSRA